MNAGATPDRELLEAACTGDGEAFRALVAPHVRALHLHCYRMLASYHDAEEAMQEALLRAWRSLGTYEGRAPLHHWLYRIATTACLKLINARARRPATFTDLDYLEPYPDRLLEDLGPGTDPAAEAERRESVSLAFIAALQLLPASQRAALVLHDVLAWRSDEIADLLETSVPAVNSALQRARASVGRAAASRRSLDTEDRRVLARFVDAWHRGDVAGLAAVLREDVVLRMPPEAMEFLGRKAVLGFFATVPGGGRFDTIRLVATRANGQPALAAFEPDAGGVLRPYGLMVLDLDGGLVSGITGFPAMPGRTIDAAFDLQPA